MPSDDRTRRRKQARGRSGPNVLVVAAVLGCALLAVVASGVAAVVYVSQSRQAKAEPTAATPPPATKTAPTSTASASVPTVLGVVAAAAPPKLPEGWAYNDPGLGFRTAWPVAAGADGFAPVNLLGNVGAGGGKSYGASSGGLVYSVSWTDPSYVPGAEEAEPLALVDRYIARQKQLAAARGAPTEDVKPVPATTAGAPGREVRGKNGVHRYVAIRGKLWVLGVISEAGGVDPADPKVTTFFDTFAVLK